MQEHKRLHAPGPMLSTISSDGATPQGTSATAGKDYFINFILSPARPRNCPLKNRQFTETASGDDMFGGSIDICFLDHPQIHSLCY